MFPNSHTTTTLFLGLATSFTNLQTTSTMVEYNEYTTKSGTIINQPFGKTRIETYVDSEYEFKSQVPNYKSLEGAFFDTVQEFAKEQYTLEKDFYDEMDKLLLSKIGNAPSKKRVW